MKSLIAGKIIKILRRNSFVLSLQKGSHQIWRNPKSGIMVSVPFHVKLKPLPVGTFSAIVKQSKIPKNQFK